MPKYIYLVFLNNCFPLDNIPNFFNSLISHENVTRHAHLHFVLFAFPYRPSPAYWVPEIDKFNMTRVLFLKVLRRTCKGSIELQVGIA